MLKRDLFGGAPHALQAPADRPVLQTVELEAEDVAVEAALDALAAEAAPDV